jgi:SAM-dependent methyltransferase
MSIQIPSLDSPRAGIDLEIVWPLPEHADSIPEVELNQHGTTVTDIPCLLRVNGHLVLAASQSLPLPAGSCRSVRCLGVLEVVRDDEQLVSEIARVLEPGGRVMLATLTHGPLGLFDSTNLYRYVRDITKRGRRPSEVAASGWRRHYRPSELRQLFRDHGIEVESQSATGLGLSELVDFAAMAGFRWIAKDEERYLAVRARVSRIRDLERRLPVPEIGFWMLMTGRRLEDE